MSSALQIWAEPLLGLSGQRRHLVPQPLAPPLSPGTRGRDAHLVGTLPAKPAQPPRVLPFAVTPGTFRGNGRSGELKRTEAWRRQLRLEVVAVWQGRSACSASKAVWADRPTR